MVFYWKDDNWGSNYLNWINTNRVTRSQVPNGGRRPEAYSWGLWISVRTPHGWGNWKGSDSLLNTAFAGKSLLSRCPGRTDGEALVHNPWIPVRNSCENFELLSSESLFQGQCSTFWKLRSIQNQDRDQRMETIWKFWYSQTWRYPIEVVDWS